MPQETSELPPVELRKTLRKRVILAGKVIYKQGAFVLDCRIRDISETGARIVVPKEQVIPTHFVLLEPKERIAFEAQIVRIRPPEYALRFTAAHMLGGPLPKHLSYLKRFG